MESFRPNKNIREDQSRWFYRFIQILAEKGLNVNDPVQSALVRGYTLYEFGDDNSIEDSLYIENGKISGYNANSDISHGESIRVFKTFTPLAKLSEEAVDRLINLADTGHLYFNDRTMSDSGKYFIYNTDDGMPAITPCADEIFGYTPSNAVPDADIAEFIFNEVTSQIRSAHDDEGKAEAMGLNADNYSAYTHFHNVLLKDYFDNPHYYTDNRISSERRQILMGEAAILYSAFGYDTYPVDCIYHEDETDLNNLLRKKIGGNFNLQNEVTAGNVRKSDFSFFDITDNPILDSVSVASYLVVSENGITVFSHEGELIGIVNYRSDVGMVFSAPSEKDMAKYRLYTVANESFERLKNVASFPNDSNFDNSLRTAVEDFIYFYTVRKKISKSDFNFYALNVALNRPRTDYAESMMDSTKFNNAFEILKKNSGRIKDLGQNQIVAFFRNSVRMDRMLHLTNNVDDAENDVSVTGELLRQVYGDDRSVSAAFVRGQLLTADGVRFTVIGSDNANIKQIADYLDSNPGARVDLHRFIYHSGREIEIKIAEMTGSSEKTRTVTPVPHDIID